MELPRIKPLDFEKAKENAKEAHVLEVYASLNIFATLLRHPKLARGIEKLLNTLLFEGQLDARYRELIILRVAWVTKSSYEWAQHYKIGKSFGLSEADITGIREWRSSDHFDEIDKIILKACDEILESGEVSESTYAFLVDTLGSDDDFDQIFMEIISVVCTWQMVSVLLRSLRVQLEADLDPWPPDGLKPL